MICISKVTWIGLCTWCSKIEISHVFKKLWCFAQFLLVQSKKVLLKSYQLCLANFLAHDRSAWQLQMIFLKFTSLRNIFRRKIVENLLQNVLFTLHTWFWEKMSHHACKWHVNGQKSILWTHIKKESFRSKSRLEKDYLDRP